MLAATWAGVGVAFAAVVLTALGMWVRVNTRMAALEADVRTVRETTGRIENAIWAQAGMALVPPAPVRDGGL